MEVVEKVGEGFWPPSMRESETPDGIYSGEEEQNGNFVLVTPLTVGKLKWRLHEMQKARIYVTSNVRKLAHALRSHGLLRHV
jgi:hypothetical protein